MRQNEIMKLNTAGSRAGEKGEYISFPFTYNCLKPRIDVLHLGKHSPLLSHLARTLNNLLTH